MFEFTTNPKGIEGVLADVEREPLCKIDGEVVTIPKQFPASVGLAFVAMEANRGREVAVVWAMQCSLGSAVWEKLVTEVDLPDTALTQLMTIVIGRMQGIPAPIPEPEDDAPKARTRAARTTTAKKSPAPRSRRSAG